MRIVFFGTPAFAVPTLRRLTVTPGVDVALVVTQPDRPAGRGRRLDRSAVGEAAGELDLPLYQPASLRDPVARQPLADTRADCFVVAAFGMIFGAKTLAMPPLGCVNVHASLLPRYRGASPIAAAIANGDERTGVTLMRMAAGLDTGPIIALAEMPIAADATTESLTRALGDLGAELTASTLLRYASSQVSARPQPEVGASLTRPLTKADGWIAWDRPGAEIERHVRAMWSWPRAWTTVAGDAVQVHRATVVPSDGQDRPGTIVEAGSALVVAAGRDALRLEEVQPAGTRRMAGASFAAGRRLRPGALVGADGGPPPSTPLVRLL